jgi:hypothetical protein
VRNTPQIVIQINEAEIPEKVEGDIHFISFPNITPMNTLSAMSYAITFHDCFPLKLHNRGPLTHDVELLLKRVFRSLDTDFDGKIQVADFSKYHEKYLGTELGPDDMIFIFEALHDGSQPANVYQFMRSSLSFEYFLKLMQHYATLGYGHIVVQIIRGADYYYFFNQEVEIKESIFENLEPQRLQNSAIAFLHNVYADYSIDNVIEQFIDEFRFSGGAPERFKNVKEMSEEIWIEMWQEWSEYKPAEAARTLLAFGFPRDLILDAFGIKKPEPNKSIGIIAGIAATALSLGGAWLLFQRRK